MLHHMYPYVMVISYMRKIWRNLFKDRLVHLTKYFGICKYWFLFSKSALKCFSNKVMRIIKFSDIYSLIYIVRLKELFRILKVSWGLLIDFINSLHLLAVICLQASYLGFSINFSEWINARSFQKNMYHRLIWTVWCSC